MATAGTNGLEIYCENPVCDYVGQLVSSHRWNWVGSRVELQLAALPAALRHPRPRGHAAALLWSVRTAIRRLASAAIGPGPKGEH